MKIDEDRKVVIENNKETPYEYIEFLTDKKFDGSYVIHYDERNQSIIIVNPLEATIKFFDDWRNRQKETLKRLKAEHIDSSSTH